MSNKFINKLFREHGGIKRRPRIIQRVSLVAMSIVTSLGFSLGPVSNVLASSSWDSLIDSTSSLYLEDTNGAHHQDVTSSYATIMSDICPTYFAEFQSALADEDGHIAIAQLDSPYAGARVNIGWSTSSSATTYFYTNDMFGNSYSILVAPQNSITLTVDTYGTLHCYTQYSDPLILGDAPNYFHRVFVSTFPATYPSGYEGDQIPNGSTTDYDQDGLNDYVESSSYPNRNNVFCDNSSPKNCAYPNPIKKDLYIEIDWINDGTEIYKPSAPQLELVRQKYADIGINFHADIGQYGGGNELSASTYEEPTDVDTDFYTYKWGYLTSGSGNFNENRYKIWRYMITGYQMDGSTISGIAEVGGDDVFISFGRMQDNPGCSPGYCYADFDDAIAGTIVHELGHNLCLSASSKYTGHDSACIFNGIDTNASVNYQSSMNYEYQFENLYSYSDGTHGLGDHDDIAGINAGFGDFTWKDDDSGVGGPS